MHTQELDYEWSPFLLRDSRSERNASARENQPTRERWDAAVREKNEGLQTKPKLLTFCVALTFFSLTAASRLSLVGWFLRALAFARSTIPEEKWRLLVVYPRAGLSVSFSDLLTYHSLLVERQPRSQGLLLLIPRSERTLGTRVGIVLDCRAERHGFDSGRINMYPSSFVPRGWANTKVLK